MIYFFSYLSLGMFLVILKSPIRRLVDWEVADLEMNCLVQDRQAPAFKLLLLRFILSVIVVALYPVILFKKLSYYYNQYKLEMILQEQCVEAEISWLGDEITVEAAIAANMERVKGQMVPFGNNNAQWLTLSQLFQEGDRLYEFRSPSETWEEYQGKEGVALVRNGIIVADLVKLLN